MVKGTFLSASLIALSLGLLSPCAYAALPPLTDVAASCAMPDYTKAHNIFYVDPVHGTATGDGSAAHPWNSLSKLVMQGYISTMPKYWDPTSPVAVKGWVTAMTNAPIHPGDVIKLMSGNYGNVVIQGFYGRADNSLDGYNNSDFITIEAAPGQTPVLGNLLLAGGNKWVFRGLTIQNIAPNLNSKAYGFLASFTGPHKDIIFDQNTLGTAIPVEGWTEAEFLKNWSQADWVANAPSGMLDKGSGYNGANCVTLTNNHLVNVGFGINSQRSNNVLIGYNTVNYFIHDALDYGSNNMVIQHNTMTNHIDAGDSSSIHPDFFQGQPYGSFSSTVDHLSNILIDSNIGIRQTDPNLPFMGPLNNNWIQGITEFDGFWTNVTVTNNVIISNAAQGISFAGVDGLLIANNTVLSDSYHVPNSLWITAGGVSHEGGTSKNTIIRNNISSAITPSDSVGMVADHNLIVSFFAGSPRLTQTVDGKTQWLSKPGTYLNNNVITALTPDKIFKTYDPATFQYDLHLLAGTPAIGTGNSAQAPAKDIAGVSRNSPVDLGAYAAITTTPVVTTPVVTTPVVTTPVETTPVETTPVVTTPVVTTPVETTPVVTTPVVTTPVVTTPVVTTPVVTTPVVTTPVVTAPTVATPVVTTPATTTPTVTMPIVTAPTVTAPTVTTPVVTTPATTTPTVGKAISAAVPAKKTIATTAATAAASQSKAMRFQTQKAYTPADKKTEQGTIIK